MTWAMIGAAAIGAVASDVNNPGQMGSALPAPQLGGSSGVGGLTDLMQAGSNAATLGEASAASAASKAPPVPTVDQPATQPEIESEEQTAPQTQGLQTASQERPGFFSNFGDSLNKYAQPGPMAGLALLQQLTGRQVAGPGLLALSLYDTWRQYQQGQQQPSGGSPLGGLLPMMGGGGGAPDTTNIVKGSQFKGGI